MRCIVPQARAQGWRIAGCCRGKARVIMHKFDVIAACCRMPQLTAGRLPCWCSARTNITVGPKEVQLSITFNSLVEAVEAGLDTATVRVGGRRVAFAKSATVEDAQLCGGCACAPAELTTYGTFPISLAANTRHAVDINVNSGDEYTNVLGAFYQIDLIFTVAV